MCPTKPVACAKYSLISTQMFFSASTSSTACTGAPIIFLSNIHAWQASSHAYSIINDSSYACMFYVLECRQKHSSYQLIVIWYPGSEVVFQLPESTALRAAILIIIEVFCRLQEKLNQHYTSLSRVICSQQADFSGDSLWHVCSTSIQVEAISLGPLHTGDLKLQALHHGSIC